MTLVPFPNAVVFADHGRRRLFITARAQMYEQDDAGLIWCDGEPICETPLRSYATPRLARLRELIRGEQAALLFDGDTALGAIHFTSVIRVLFGSPEVGPEIDPSWLAVARYDLLTPRHDPA